MMKIRTSPPLPRLRWLPSGDVFRHSYEFNEQSVESETVKPDPTVTFSNVQAQDMTQMNPNQPMNEPNESKNRKRIYK